MAKLATELERSILYQTIRKAKRRRKIIRRTIQYAMMRRKRQLKLCLLLLLLITSGRRTVPVGRSCRRIPRNTGWWENVWNTYSKARFKKTFRVSRATFNYLLTKIRCKLERQFVTEEPISPALRLAICLYRLGRGSYYYTIAEMSGLGISTVCTITSEVSQAIIDCLWKESVSKYMPKSPEDFKEKIIDMNVMWQFPSCWAALDGSHIPIKCPTGGMIACKEYHNFKIFYSIVLMGMVDSHYRFIWARCGYPGNSHDAIILQSTQLWSDIKEGTCIPEIKNVIGGVNVLPLIIADSAFPLEKWLMKPYGDAVLSEKQKYFNYRLSRARMVTEGAYGQLKGRWRVLLKKCESTDEEVRRCTLACVVLHNVCIEKGDTISPKLDLSTDPVTHQRRDPEIVRELLEMRASKTTKDTNCCPAAKKVRDCLADKLWLEKINGKVN